MGIPGEVHLDTINSSLLLIDNYGVDIPTEDDGH
jgi:hypothetical protein